jgi:Na+-transporting methylmalonyl-CoA/oxaloacetate decarboxylase gamma subunit
MKQIWHHIEVTDKKVREFGIVIFVVVGLIIPAVILYKNNWEITRLAQNLFICSGLFGLLCIILKKKMGGIYRAWMLLAIGMGFVMTRLIISLVFILLMTPIGVFRRLKGNKVADSFHDFSKKGESTYWIKRDEPYIKESTERQF